ncbi:MAG: TatD family hydrolase [Bacteroidales bacterium]|nr:TatD family hydrolase [Bacteroidales bacterium]
MIDTHTHLFVEQFDDDRSEVIARAKQAGVECTIEPNVSVESLERLAALCDAEPAFCRPLYGLHPTDLTENYLTELEAIFRFADERGDMVGVGEIGLDFYWDKSLAVQQIDAFRRQIDISIERQLPMSVHCRNAFEQLWKVFADYEPDKLVGSLHCFSGTADDAQLLVERYPNMMIGLNGSHTYKKSITPELLGIVPKDRILLETDAPYLAPVPNRGKRNEPAYIRFVAEHIAQILNITTDEVDQITTDNAKRLFGL